MATKNNEKKKKAQQKKDRSGIIKAVCVILTLAILATGIFWIYDTTAYIIKSRNFRLTKADMQYVFYDYLEEFIENNPQFMIETKKSLKKQDYMENFSLFKYFSAMSFEEAKENVNLAEYAIQNGEKLTAEDEKQYDTFIAEMKADAEKNGVSLKKYIKQTYGKNVSEKNVYKLWKIEALADKGYACIEKQLQFTDSEIEEYFNANKKSYMVCDVRVYDFIASGSQNMTDEEKKNEQALTKNEAEGFIACKTESEIDKYMFNYFAAQDTVGLTMDYVKAQTTKMAQTIDTDTLFDTWIMQEGRKAGDTFVNKVDEGRYTAYYVVKAPYKNIHPVVNISLLAYANSTANQELVDEALELMKRNGSREYFENFVYSLDNKLGAMELNVNVPTVKYESGSAEIDAWLFDENRKAGDITVISHNGMQFFIYYVSNGGIKWENDINNDMFMQGYTKIFSEFLTDRAADGRDKLMDKVSGNIPSLLAKNLYE